MAQRAPTKKAPALAQAALRQQRAGHPELAIELYEQALRLEPDSAGLLCNLGEACRKLGRLDRALTVLRRAVRLEPSLAPAHYNLGVTLEQRAEPAAALEAYASALELEPDLPNLLALFVEGLRGMARYDAALSAYMRFAPFVTDTVRLRRAIGVALLDVFRVDEALAHFRAALELDPASAEAYAELAGALIEGGEAEAAIEALRRSLALDPSQSRAQASLVYLLPFAASSTGEATLLEALRFQALHADAVVRHSGHHRAGERLRVGYVSADFRDHPTALFVAPLLEHHDRSVVEVFCYSAVAQPDATTTQLLALADTARDISRLDDDAAAQQIFDDGIDVLVDLAMHTGQSRPLLFARKPAPIQACWLAYPGTTGLSALDYRLTDAHLDPPGLPAHYSERSIYLDSYWCYAPPITDPEPSPLPGLSNGFPTFGSLHSFKKVSPAALELWARVLCAVPMARFIAIAPSGESSTRLLETLAAHGVDPARVEIVRHAPRARYLEVFASIDCCLDTWPYGGGTSSLDSFWMGVPVVSLVGPMAVGRAGSCLAQHLGLPELVAGTPLELVERARAVVADLGRLSELRAGLRARLRGSLLMDGPKFARNMEAALSKMSRHP